MSYTKLANSILTSTVWMEDDHTRIVWFALLAMADRNGEVQASIPGLANIARVPIESCRAAIARFLSPDPDSRSKIDDGRRLSEIKGGWFLVNHPEYRELASDEDRKLKAAIRQQRFRDSNARNKTVTLPSRQIPQAEADADTKEEKTSSKKEQVLCEEQIRLGKLFNRRPTTKWSEAEIKLWKAITPIHTDDIAKVERFFKTPGSFHRKQLATLLANWNGEVDLANGTSTQHVKPSIPVAQPRCGVGHNFV